MRSLSASDLLTVWERGIDAGPTRRALELLSAACVGVDRETLATLSIGQRDELLLRLRQQTFGSAMTGLVDCARCGECIELTFDPADLPAAAPATEIAVTIDQYELTLRPPNSRDLASASASDLDRARLQLLECCLLSARRQDVALTARELPDAVLTEVERLLSEGDPLSDIQLAATCPACEARRIVTFDVVPFFWQEIEAWVQRILREVHTLAMAYGWGEQEVLALTPIRRRCYLDLVGA